MNRSIRRLYLALAGGFGLLVLMLGWWQVVAAGDLRDRPGNIQTAQAERLIDRGRILSADGKVLAASRARRIKGQRVFERLYPQGTLAANAVGYVSDSAGKTGIESTYNRYLSGSFGTEPLLQRLSLKEKRGADVRLSLDSRVQLAAEQALAGNSGAAVAFDPRTGPDPGHGLVAHLRPAAGRDRLRSDPHGGVAVHQSHDPGHLPARLDL